MSVILLLAACGSSSICAQTIVGRISGTMTDTSGAVIANATVTVTNTANNLVRTGNTNDSGFYTLTNLPVGTYTLVAELTGFKKALKADNVLAADARLTVDVVLEPGQVSETVEVVTSGSEAVNTTSGEVARVIDGQQVQNLALNGRNYVQLLSLVPGVALTTDDQLELSTSLATNTQSINGNRGQMTNMTVDGGTNLQSGSNASQINNVGIDFIREVKIQTANFSAEYGRNSGAQVNVVTRSGGNNYHDSGFEFLRNNRLDARNSFAPVKSPLRYNDFGYSIGGPIKKDKFFFFGGQEWKKIRRLGAPVVRTVPTLAELNGDFSFRLRGADGIVGTALYNPAQAVTVLANGTIDTTKGGNRYNGLIRAGNGVPSKELGRVPGGDSAAVLAVPAGAARGLYEPHHYFMPRVGFAYAPFKNNKTSIRGGFGMYYDRVEGNIVFPSLGNPPFATSAQFSNANLSNISSGGCFLSKSELKHDRREWCLRGD